ncbi:MAG: hypothetical protein KGP10_09425 [Actinomycetales bacterium]|nr:hypothetical protein [Actinomycetales bacterium]
MRRDVDVIIPARRGSVGLARKNMRELVDRPLALHSVACAGLVAAVRRVLVTTDDEELAALAVAAGAEVPELRPSHLARGDTPMAEVVRYAVALLDSTGGVGEFVLLLDPTSPLRMPGDISAAVGMLRADGGAVGVVSVSRPVFNPLWVGVRVAADGGISPHEMSAGTFVRRQDVPEYWRINGSFYVWRTGFARTLTSHWLTDGRHLGWVTREVLSHSIDSADDLAVAGALISAGVVSLPWLGDGGG